MNQVLNSDCPERHALSVQDFGQRMRRGVVGTAFGMGPFLRKQGEASLDDFLGRPETALKQLFFHQLLTLRREADVHIGRS
jgi:hypothetical protein